MWANSSKEWSTTELQQQPKWPTHRQKGRKVEPQWTTSLPSKKQSTQLERKRASICDISQCNQSLRQSMDWCHTIRHVQTRNYLKTMENHKKLNENPTATIHTKHGPTRKIRIKVSIWQGGVLSVLQYALLVDEISKEVQEKDLGIEIPDTTTKLACLLWMDDVLLLETRPKEKQELMDTNDKIAEKYQI